VVAPLLGSIEDLAKGPLEAIDDRCQLLGIDKVKVGVELEIASRRLQPFEFIAHATIIRNTVR